MKKTLSLVLLVFAFFGCKKANTNPQYVLKGTWVLSSININGQVSLATDYPCLANNTLVFGSGSSATMHWSYATTCWITPDYGVSYNATDGLVLNFARNGNGLYLPPLTTASATYGTIASVNGQLQIALRDTVQINNPLPQTNYNSQIYIKQ
jgi:hypothetical protein